jgi:hypothetical protein
MHSKYKKRSAIAAPGVTQCGFTTYIIVVSYVKVVRKYRERSALLPITGAI